MIVVIEQDMPMIKYYPTLLRWNLASVLVCCDECIFWIIRVVASCWGVRHPRWEDVPLVLFFSRHRSSTGESTIGQVRHPLWVSASDDIFSLWSISPLSRCRHHFCMLTDMLLADDRTCEWGSEVGSVDSSLPPLMRICFAPFNTPTSSAGTFAPFWKLSLAFLFCMHPCYEAIIVL